MNVLNNLKCHVSIILELIFLYQGNSYDFRLLVLSGKFASVLITEVKMILSPILIDL